MRTTYCQSILIAAAIPLAAIPATSAEAQQSRFTTGQVQVVNAASIIEDAKGGRYAYGEQLRMTVRASEVQRLAGRKLQARIFVLPSNGGLPGPWNNITFDPCDVYYTLLVPDIRIGVNRIIDLGPLKNLAWLMISSGKLGNGKFRVVFEANGERRRVFRLNRNDRSAYFSQSLYIEVSPPTSHSYNIEAIRQAESRLAAEAARVTAVANQNIPAWSCYKYRRAQVGTPTNGHITSLAHCQSEPSAGGV